MSKLLSVSETHSLTQKLYAKDKNRSCLFFSSLIAFLASTGIAILSALLLMALTAFVVIWFAKPVFDMIDSYPFAVYDYLLKDGTIFVAMILVAIFFIAGSILLSGLCNIANIGNYSVINDMTKTGKASLESYNSIWKNFGRKWLLAVLHMLYTCWPPIVAAMISFAFARNQLASLSVFASESIIMYRLTRVVIVFTVLLIISFFVSMFLLIKYSQAYFIISEDSEITAVDALNKSSELMEGHIFDYFKLCLSFWWIYVLFLGATAVISALNIEVLTSLSSVVFSLVLNCVAVPYIITALAIFHRGLVGDIDTARRNYDDPSDSSFDNNYRTYQNSFDSSSNSTQTDDTNQNNVQSNVQNNEHYDSGDVIRSKNGIDGEASEKINSNKGIDGEVKE